MISRIDARLVEQLHAQIRTGLLARGWRELSGDAVRFAAPGVEAPLRADWLVGIDTAKTGGARVIGLVNLRDDEVTAALLPLSARAVEVGLVPEGIAFGPDEIVLGGVVSRNLRGSGVDAGGWRVWDEDHIDRVRTTYFAAIDGPVTAWIRQRRTADLVLDGVRGRVMRKRLPPREVRALAVLALQRGRSRDAEKLLHPRRSADPRDSAQLAAFRRELAVLHPEWADVLR